MIDLKLSNGTKLDIEYPIILRDKDGNRTYYETSNGYWAKWEYTNDNKTYFEDSNGYWAKYEYTNGKETYFENSDGYKEGTPKSNKKQEILDQIEVLKKQAEEL